MINLFRLALAATRLRLLYVTVQVGQSFSWDPAGDVIFGDLANLWRAQFSTDLLGFLLVIAVWMVWHFKSLPLGAEFRVFSVLGGGLFTFAYPLVQSDRLNGNVSSVLLGGHYRVEGEAA